MLLKNCWYALADSDDVGATPVKVRALGEDLVLFRRSSDRMLVALSDTCVHRMASLSRGEVDGDCVRCPYHGWAYAADGACVQVPSNPAGAPVSRRARVDSYPVEERYGWIWVFLGDLPEPERPPIPPFPEFGQAGWRAVRGTVTWNAHYTRVVENTADVAHTPFVHRASFGDPHATVIPEFTVAASEHAVQATIVLPRPAPPRKPRRGGYGEVTLAIYMPATNRVDGVMANGWRTLLLITHVPVDEHTTLTRFVQLRNFLRSPLADGLARRFSLKILAEDRPTVESQVPRVAPIERGADLSTRADALTLAYRKLLRDYVDRGWQIDHHEVQRTLREDDRLLVIPSPRRRDPELARVWVLDEVPVVVRSR